MNDQNKQQDSQLTPEEAKASMGIATHLQEQMLAVQNPQPDSSTGGSQTPETAPQSTDDSKPMEGAGDEKLTNMEGKIEQKMEIMRTELKDTIKTEIDSIRQDIKTAIDNEGNEQG